MDSFLTTKLKEKTIVLINYFRLDVSTEHYITYAVILNAFAIFALYRGGFTLFFKL